MPTNNKPGGNRLPELSCYLLPGQSRAPADAIAQAQQAEALALGMGWLSERFDVIGAGVICAAAMMDFQMVAGSYSIRAFETKASRNENPAKTVCSLPQASCARAP